MEDSVAKKINMECVENQTVRTSNLEDSIDIKDEPVEFKDKHFECYRSRNEEHYMEDSVAQKLNMECVENQTLWTSNLEDSIDINEEPVEFKEESLECYEQVKIEIFHDDNQGEEIHPEIGFSTEDIEASQTILDTYRNSCKDSSLFQHTYEQYLRSKNFSKHSHIIETHSGDKPHQCEICIKRFVRKSDLTVHLRLHSGEKPYHCDICNKSFSLRCNLTTHSRMHSGEKPFRCDICGKSFSVRSNLNSHSRIHCGYKPYNCDICNKSFSQRSNLTTHSRQHSGEKPFRCDICNKSFSVRANLTSHSRIHSDEKPYHCDICGKSFAQNSALTVHARVHSGEKPYHCDICNKSFSHSSALRRHSRIHSREKL